jgi:hypothetical protein
MSRWLWALLGGVVLVAIAAVFWAEGDRTKVAPPVSPPAPVASAPPPAAPVSAPSTQEPKPPPASAPAAQQAPPSPAPTQDASTPSAPAPASSAPAPTSEQAASPTAPAPSAGKPPAPPAVAQEPAPPPAAAPVAEAPLPPPAPGREKPEAEAGYAPRNLEQLVGAWAYSAEDCDKLFQRRGGGWVFRQPVDKFAQAAIVESPKKFLLPSATCQIERTSAVEGALKVSAECADSISYTSRSTVIMLRSATELVYSASGDPVLATTLKKCAP